MTALHDDPVRVRAVELAGADDDRADLIHAAELIITSGLGSWRMLQRKMRLAQGHAQRVLNALQDAGIVGPDVGDPRDVLVLPADLEATLARLAVGGPGSASDDQAGTASDGLALGLKKTTSARLAVPATDDLAVPAQVPVERPVAVPATTTSAGASMAKRTASEVAGTDDQDDDQSAPRQRQLLVAVKRSGSYVVNTIRKDNLATRTVKRTARTAYTAGQGGRSWVTRGYAASNHGMIRQRLRMATTAGDEDKIEKLDEILDKRRNNRISRLQRLPSALAGVGITVGVLAVVLAVVLVVVGGLAGIAWGWAGWHFWWWLVGLAVVVFAWLVVGLCALALTLAVPVTVTAMHREGKRVADPPRWMLSLNERRGIDALITPARIAIALRDCGLSELRKYIKESDDGGGDLIGTITPAGRGVEVEIRPPTFISTDQLLARRRRLAEALDRHQHELYMSIVAARTLKFWIADPGALDEPLSASPLVTAGAKAIKASMEKGACPWGENLRGDLVSVKLWQRHLTIAGLSNHGKTFAARALLLWLAYDVNVEFRIADLKGVGDWDMFGPIDGTPGLATVYISGPAEQHAIEATLMLEDAVEEMKRRLASGRKDWPPLLCVVDEAQRAFMNMLLDEHRNPYGGAKNTSRYFNACREIENQGRVVNVLLHQYLQDPTDQNFPEMVREGAHIRISLVVGTPSKSRMALGEAAVEGGAAPHLLRRDIDKGVVVMHGGVDIPRGESSITVRTYFIDDPDAWVLARGAIEKRRKAGRTPLVIDATPIVIDSLRDIYEAMRGENRVKTTVVLSRMREENPDVYEHWSNKDFAASVREYVHLGLDIRTYGGDSVLRIEEVEQALRERE